MSDLAKNISALVIASDKDSATSLADTLSAYLGEVHIVSSMPSARETFRATKTPVVVIDDSVNPEDRVSLVKELCWEDPHVLIAMAAGEGFEDVSAEALKSGASDILCKPIDKVALSDLLSRFASVIARREYKRFSPELFERVQMDLSLIPSAKAVNNAVMLLSEFLSVAFGERELLRLELGFQEVLRNALEHGCLGVDYHQKKELCERAAFDEYVEEVSKKARAGGESIQVNASYFNDKIVVSVTDSGEGFDWKTMKETMEAKAPDEGFSGRGLMLIQRVFDDVSYNDQGNQTILTIKF
jgi:anti-sigma regulatory factor (Ser/Thr protein kinase)